MKITIVSFLVVSAMAAPDLAPVVAFGNATVETVICWAGLLVFADLALLRYGMGWSEHRL